MSETLNEVVQTVRKSVRTIGAAFTKHDDDWLQFAFLARDGDRDIHIVPLDEWLEPRLKGALCKVVLPGVIRNHKSDVVVLLLNTWVSRVKDDESRPTTLEEAAEVISVRPSEDPDRMEQLLIAAYTADGVQEVWMAPINRDPRGVTPPTLGAWEKSDKEGESIFDEGIVTALEEVRLS